MLNDIPIYKTSSNVGKRDIEENITVWRNTNYEYG